MLIMRALTALVLGLSLVASADLVAGDAPGPSSPSATAASVTPVLPPSPSAVSGERIWPPPAFTHWPAIAYDDESRNVVFALPNKTAGQPGTIGWSTPDAATGTAPAALPFTTPADTDRASGLLPLPLTAMARTAVVDLAGSKTTLDLRVVDAREAWPIAALRDGFPIDEHGVPVVLLDRRRNANDERKWLSLRKGLTRPSGRGLLIGDPLEALGATAWSDADADLATAMDDRYPHHAVLAGLAKKLAHATDAPRTIAWCPGNQILFGAAWNEEEVRIFGVVRTRCEALGIHPRMVVILPPVPLDDRLHDLAIQRRELLTSSATVQDWAILDLERIAGPAEKANKVGDGLFTRYPNRDAQAKVRKALKDELAR